MLAHFQFLKKQCEIAHVMAEDDDSLAGGAAFPRRPQVNLERDLPRPRYYSSRPRKTYRRR